MTRFRVAVVALLSVMAFSLVAQNRDWANLQRFDNDNKTLIKQGPDKRRVVFLGNSITEGWASQRPEFFSSNDFVGRGISGQTSSQFLARFRNDVINLQPKLVVINAGTNDIAENTGVYNEELTFGNIVSMVELAKANGIKVILTTVLPAARFGWNPSITDSSEKIIKLNARVAEYAKQNKIPFVDYYTPMVHGADHALNPAYSKDGVHPTAEGYEVMEAVILPAVRKIVK